MSDRDATTTTGTDPRDAALGTVSLRREFGGLVAVDDVDLAVSPGELHAIIGPNGAGKTTLFNVITAALPPTAGSVYLHGEDITDVPEEERPHRGLARSFQSSQLFTELSVLENVRLAVQTAQLGSFSFSVLGEGRTAYRDRAREFLEHVGLTDKAEATAANLSHGDQRRLAIAITLATEPSVVLLDEPTSGMGPTETEETAELIEGLRDDLDLTVLLIEHDMDVVLSISDRITVLNQGEAIATGPPDEIQANDAVQEAYLGGMREEL